MGCWFTKPATNSASGMKPVKYSWDAKEKINPADFTIEKVNKTTAGRLPGTIKGEQFIIQNCQDANIYLFDHSNTITIDDCCRCNLFIGPVKGSVFLRDCTDCHFIIACQQFRVRDCRQCDVYLFCSTQPIIESSSAIKFACFSYNYPELEGQFRAAGLSEFINNWSEVHDFTPVEDDSNWDFIKTGAKNRLPSPDGTEFSQVQTSDLSDQSFVPQTIGPSRRGNDESCLVVFFSDGQSHQRAKSFIELLKDSKCNLVNTKEVSLDENSAKTIFNSESYSQVVTRGPVIGLEYNGSNCVHVCQSSAMNIATDTGSTGLVYVSSNPQSAVKQIDHFFNYASMQMS